MRDFIGIVDLTVRHTSMNPFGHIDVHEASGTFEQLLLYACKAALDRHGAESAAGLRMRKRGIVKEGPAAKYFQFESGDDALDFAVYVRSLLLEKGLPFKLCLARGTLGVEDLRSTWSPVIEAASRNGGDPGTVQARERLLLQFGTADPTMIDRLLQTYRAPGLHQDAIALALDLDAFKGFGIWIDPDLGATDVGTGGDHLFRNFQPARTRGGAKQRWEGAAYVDVRLPRIEEDVITRRPGGAVELMPTGQGARIANVVDLLRRSLKAGDENAVYYVSLLTTIVRSSHFGAIRELTASEPESRAAGASTLAAGWQDHPPIFQAIVLDATARSLFKRVDGIELVLAAMIDEIHAALTREPPSCGLDPYRRPTGQTPAERSALHARLSGAVTAGSPFASAVRRIEAVFGEPMLRKVWAVPAQVLNEERKRAALNVATSR